MLRTAAMSAREPVHPEELLLLDYVIGQLPDETRDQIKRHVAGCRACRRTIDDLILTVDELDRLPTMAIPHDSPAELAAARTRPRSRIRFFVPALALVLFALLAIVTLGGSRGGSSKSPPMQTFSLSVPKGDVAEVQRLLPLESAQFVFAQESGDYVVLAPRALVPSIVQDLRSASVRVPGSTKVYVVSSGDADIRSPSAS
jgi:predicted anti-sigma-YlaC factor YlaD